jgi:hypothetical protein
LLQELSLQQKFKITMLAVTSFRTIAAIVSPANAIFSDEDLECKWSIRQMA